MLGGRLHGRIASDPDGQPAGEGVPGLDAREPAASYPDLGNVSRRADPFEPPYAISDGLDLNADPASATPRRAGPSGMLIGPRDVPHGTADASRALRSSRDSRSPCTRAGGWRDRRTRLG